MISVVCLIKHFAAVYCKLCLMFTDCLFEQGQSFMAINPDMFEPGFPDRMQELINTCRSTPLVCKYCQKTLLVVYLTLYKPK